MQTRTDALRGALEAAAARGRLVITGHDTPDVDSVISCVLLKALCGFWNIPAEIVLPTPADKQSHRVMARFGYDVDAWRGETFPEDELAIVDHHQPLHAGHLTVCIDHHPTDYPPDCAFLLIEPAGACAGMLFRLMEEAGMETTRRQKELAVCGLYLDTIALRSVKIPKEEADWARRQAEELHMDIGWLEKEGMGLQDMSLPAETLALCGKKVYQFGEKRVISSYVQTNAMTPDKLEALLSVLKAAVFREGAALWVFLVHDPQRLRSTRYDITPDGGVKAISYDVLASRGKTVMPEVEIQMRRT